MKNIKETISRGKSTRYQKKIIDFYEVLRFVIQYITNQQDATLAVLYLLTTTSMLYMFRTPFASIIRSTINCNSHHWCLS